MGTTRYTVLDGEILSENRNGTKRDYVPDPLGSTVALLDNTQTKTDTFGYWPYGEESSRTGTTATPFRYVGTAGYYRDGEARTYVRARELHTQQGRWMTLDPIGFEGGDWNLYRYVGNNPATFSDPLGMITNKECMDACDALFKKNKDKQQCKKICRSRTNGPGCGPLRRYCEHIAAHSNEDPGGSADFKICKSLYERLCQPWDNNAQSCPKAISDFAQCSDGQLFLMCLGAATCIVICLRRGIIAKPEPIRIPIQ